MCCFVDNIYCLTFAIKLYVHDSRYINDEKLKFIVSSKYKTFGKKLRIFIKLTKRCTQL